MSSQSVPNARPRRPPFDPEAAPIVSRGSADEAISTRQLTAPALRSAFERARPWDPEPTDESRWALGRVPTAAAVLVPLVQAADDSLAVMLTRRTAHLHDHAGQISFPGGRVDEGDSSRVHTALREAHEEVGLAAEAVEIVGVMPEYLTGTGFVVTPVVGIVHSPLALRTDPFEVAEVFEAPLAFLMNPAHHETRAARWTENEVMQVRHFYSMPFETAAARYFIWGATAAMLRNLYRFLRAQT